MTMRSRSRTLLAAALLVASAACCAGGQTGDEGDAARCEQKPQQLALGEVSALGFSAARALALAEGAHAASFEWQPSTTVPYGPEAGPAELSLEVQSLGRARFVRRSWGEGSIRLDGGGCCQDAVQIDVRVTLRTSGGALNETFDTKLEATKPDVAYLSLLLKPPLTGSLAFDEQALGDAHLEDVQLDVRFAANELSGSIIARIESEPSAPGSDGVVSLTIEPLAEWGQSSGAQLCSE
jgi:hypothetical protein